MQETQCFLGHAFEMPSGSTHRQATCIYKKCDNKDQALVQCGRSSLSQDGGANLQPHFIKKNQTTLNKWMGRPQLLPVIFEIVLRPIWWATGTEQQSPPSSPAEGWRRTEAISVAQVVLQYLLAQHIPYFPIL